MSRMRARDTALRLQGIRKSLDALPATDGVDPEMDLRIHSLQQLVNHLETLAPEAIDTEVLSTLEGLIQSVDTGIIPHEKTRQSDAQDISKRLQNAREGLDALLAICEDDPETLDGLRRACRVVDHMQTMAPEEVDMQTFSAIEELVHVGSMPDVEASAEEITLYEQGVAYLEKFQRWGVLRDLEQAIASFQRVVQLIPNYHPNMPGLLTNLGAALLMRFEQVGSRADLEAAISRVQTAVNLTSDGHPNKPCYLSNLGGALRTRFDRYGLEADLEDAILQARKAVDLTPDGHPEKPDYLSGLGCSLQTRFERHGSLVDLDDSISQKQRAVDLIHEDHPKQPGYLNNLSNSLNIRFMRLGSPVDLEAAISQSRKAIDLTPDGHPGKAIFLDNLGNSLGLRFGLDGSLADLEEAILQRRMAVDLTPDDHPKKPRFLNNLGNTLLRRFDHHGSLADLEEANLQCRAAVDLTPDGHPDKPMYLSRLGSGLQMYYERNGGLVDLEDSISQQQKAIHLTPNGHPHRPDYHNKLGNALERLFDERGSPADLEEAILQKQKAVDLTPDGHPDKPIYLNNLANGSEHKFRRDGALADLEEAILQRQRALQLTSPAHPDRAMSLHSLSEALRMRFGLLGGQHDLQDALLAAQESVECPTSSSMLRLRYALSWANCCTVGSISPLPAFEWVINLLPRVAWLGLAVDDQYFLLAQAGSAARDAVATAISDGEYAKAIEWAEQGRSIVWQNLLNLRTPLDGLQTSYPDLAKRLQELSKHLERPSETQRASNGSTPLDSAGNQITLAVERDKLIEEIRKKAGFGSFMRARSLEQLASAARDGPVIFLNLGQLRCDALALLTDDHGAAHVVPVPLERVTLQKAEQLSDKLVTLLSKTGVRARSSRKHKTQGTPKDKNAAFKEILQTLWLDYVKPILDGLAYQVNLESPPRLWWCTTGPLAFLPLHAAGIYDLKEAGHKTSDYVVSSYTPTLTALLDEPSPVSSNELKILTVAISNTPGAPLPSTEEEVRMLHHLAANLPAIGLRNEEATKERVLVGLKESTWVHLACHGEQVGGKPMESGLILHDGKLKLSEIVKTNLPKADLAFLSACQTAVGDGGVPEESAHLAAGMLFAGYRGVVATMWSIQDDIAPRVAEDFYRYMFRNGKPNRLDAAYALHKAVRSLWESGAPFTSWVPFIHIGR